MNNPLKFDVATTPPDSASLLAAINDAQNELYGMRVVKRRILLYCGALVALWLALLVLYSYHQPPVSDRSSLFLFPVMPQIILFVFIFPTFFLLLAIATAAFNKLCNRQFEISSIVPTLEPITPNLAPQVANLCESHPVLAIYHRLVGEQGRQLVMGEVTAMFLYAEEQDIAAVETISRRCEALKRLWLPVEPVLRASQQD